MQAQWPQLYVLLTWKEEEEDLACYLGTVYSCQVTDRE